MDPEYDWREGPVLALIERLDVLLNKLDELQAQVDDLTRALKAGAVGAWTQREYPQVRSER